MASDETNLPKQITIQTEVFGSTFFIDITKADDGPRFRYSIANEEGLPLASGGGLLNRRAAVRSAMAQIVDIQIEGPYFFDGFE